MPPEGPGLAPGPAPGWGGLDRVKRTYQAAPAPLRVIIAITCCLIGFPVALLFAPYAVVSASRSIWATTSVTLWGLLAVYVLAHGVSAPHTALVALPIAAAFAAHAGALGRWYVPCRTVAWILLLALLPGIEVFRLIDSGTSFIGPGLAWLVAFVVLGWRLAKAWQDSKQAGRPQQVRGGGPMAPPWSVGQPGLSGYPRPAGHPAATKPLPGGPARPGSPGPGGRAGPDLDGRIVTGGRTGQVGPNAQAAGSGAGDRGDRLASDQPVINVEEAMAELDAMIGLTAVKDQVRSIAASIEAARRRALAGIGAEKPMQHFVFLGPPGTGKTAVARIVAKVFYAFGLLDVPTVVEAQRSDLVGEYLGATAIKTNELIDRALGGVLIIDEAYSLVNEGDGQSDRFGNEAVQVLLKRAEDDRDRLVIILAGYERQMESFLASNPGLTSRFAVRIKFGGYSPAELLQLADLSVARRGEIIHPQARSVLWRMFEEVGRRRLGDELGNGRFVRSLLERTGQARDVRVMGESGDPAPADLITLRAADFEHAYAEFTSRYRGYDETPTLESALAELDDLVGLA